jgi:hypothetical protein
MSRQENKGQYEGQVKTREERVEPWERRLRWSATGHGWFAKTEEVSIFVSEESYERRLREYLAAEGMEWKAWSQIMRPAEEEWERQCEAVQRFQEHVDYWLKSNDRGVQIYQRRGKVV